MALLDFDGGHRLAQVLPHRVAAQQHGREGPGGRVLRPLVALAHSEHMAFAVAPEVPVVEPIDVEVVAAFDALPVGDAVEIEDPALLRRVLEVAGVVVEDQADAARLEPGQSQKAEHVIVECRLSDDLVVRGQRLRADEPVVLHTVEVAPHERAEVIFGLQRNTRPEEVVVVVPDLAADGEPVIRCWSAPNEVRANRACGGGVRGRVLRTGSEDGQLRLRSRTCWR